MVAGVSVADDVARAASSGDDVWRLAGLGDEAGSTRLTLLVEEGQTGKLVEAGTQGLDVALTVSDLTSWSDQNQPDDDWELGEGAPDYVAHQMATAAQGMKALTKTHLTHERYWMQACSSPTGDRVVTYDLKEKQVHVLQPRSSKAKRSADQPPSKP